MSSDSFTRLRTVYTVGHGHVGLGDFITVLRDVGVQMLVDVRARWWNPFIAEYTKESMKMDLLQAGIVYFFEGHRLGPRPPEPELVAEDGSINYGRWERSSPFVEGIEWIMERSREGTVCLMGGQPEPWNCHRHYLIAQALLVRGVTVQHLLPDGSLRAATADVLHWRDALPE